MPQGGAELLIGGGQSEAGDYGGRGFGAISGTWVRWKNLYQTEELGEMDSLLFPLGGADRGAPPWAPSPLDLLAPPWLGWGRKTPLTLGWLLPRGLPASFPFLLGGVGR